MNSVLDGIGGTDSDTSGTSGDGEPKMKRRAISLKAVVEAIDNSPSKKEPQRDPLLATKPMPQLTPAPRAFFDRAVSERQSKESELLEKEDSPGDEKSSKPKVVKRERFWEYEEVDDKPKEKNKRKLPNELARLQDTEEYLEASKGIKSSSNISERSKRPPRRAAIRARETVNFLHGNVENGLELRGTRKALEKADMSEEEQSDEEKMVQDSSFLSNSDLFDADSGDESQPPRRKVSSDKDKHSHSHNISPSPKPKKPKMEKSKSDTLLSRPKPKPDFGGIFNSSPLTSKPSFKIPKKKNKEKDREKEKKSPKVEKEKSSERSKSSKEDRNGNIDQEKWSQRVEEIKVQFHNWVNSLELKITV